MVARSSQQSPGKVASVLLSVRGRIEAAKRNTSVSRLVGEMLGEKMRRDDVYERAMREALEFKSFGASTEPYFTRDEIYDRALQRSLK